MNILKIRNEIRNGKTIFDLPLRVTFYARVSTDKDEQLNSLENQVQYYTQFIQEKRVNANQKMSIFAEMEFHSLTPSYHVDSARIMGFKHGDAPGDNPATAILPPPNIPIKPTENGDNGDNLDNSEKITLNFKGGNWNGTTNSHSAEGDADYPGSGGVHQHRHD